jgi:hypothetical protein
MQVPQASAQVARESLQEEAEVAYNLSHANIVNTLSHEIKCCGPTDSSNDTSLTLYLIQVCMRGLVGVHCVAQFVQTCLMSTRVYGQPCTSV